MHRSLALALFLGALVATVPARPAAADVPIAVPAPELDPVAVDGPDYRAAQARFDQLSASLATATATVATTTAELQQLQAADAELTAELVAATHAKKIATVAMVYARRGLRALAVDAYVEGQPDPLDPSDVAAVTNILTRATLARAIGDEQAARFDAAAAEFDRTSRTISQSLDARTLGRQRAAVVQADHDQAAADSDRLTQQLATQKDVRDRARVTSFVVGEDFQLVTLDAYWRAAVALSADTPDCGIPWWALAGIGRIESHHATYGGARVLANGDVDRIIVGIPLDGTNDTELIPDSDGGQYDGDPDYDHAVGPMQFIPSTWRRWARDGNGDRTSDPNNIYDAALTAGRYLCSGGPMRTDDDLHNGFLRYNHSDSYADAVLAYAKGYASYRFGGRQ